jgi:hypothetical protein
VGCSILGGLTSLNSCSMQSAGIGSIGLLDFIQSWNKDGAGLGSWLGSGLESGLGSGLRSGLDQDLDQDFVVVSWSYMSQCPSHESWVVCWYNLHFDVYISLLNINTIIILNNTKPFKWNKIFFFFGLKTNFSSNDVVNIFSYTFISSAKHEVMNLP